MGNIAIETRNLGKRYKLGMTLSMTNTLRDSIVSLPGMLKNKLTQKREKPEVFDPDTPPGTFWALKDIDLDINHGDVVGIIGRNGSGKSTLLKVLSRITTPTRGKAKIHGRVGSLLEVGTGFHPELSGRENIYLNGSILGMSKAEIDRKFDEIVDFSEIEKFLDTPIKRYSSGMTVRLAFAVAAHLEPEILIVDEVLAVGDAAFQKKSLGKMKDVSREGRTVLFVSHNMAAVKNLCEKGIWLNGGRMEFWGDMGEVINKYMEESGNNSTNKFQNPVIREEDETKLEKPYIKEVIMTDKNGKLANSFSSTDEIHLTLKIENENNNIGDFNAVWFLKNDIDKIASSGAYQLQNIQFNSQIKEINCIIYPEALVPGNYSIGFDLQKIRVKTLDHWDKAITFLITENDYYNSGFNYPGAWNDGMFVRNKWIK